MTSLMEFMARKQAMSEMLSSMPHDEMAAAIKLIQEKAEMESPFKKGQLVRVCRSPGISFGDNGMEAMPHDHDDPEQHEDSCVLGWDCFGNIMVASRVGKNPHICEISTTDDMVHPREGDDWKERSRFKPGVELIFRWDQGGWDHRRIGDITRAVLVEAHIEIGDWFVEYEKPDGNWITRVVNEKFFQVG